MQLSYKLENFEGPLDLLLVLISKNKLNINDISISFLLEQYMEQIELMKSENLDIASEFLEMAARLVYIKSVSLLPKHEDEQEELTRELTGQLLEYQLCKEVAKKISGIINFDSLIREQENVPVDMTYKRTHDVGDLVKYYFLAVGKGKRFLPPPKEKFNGIISHRIVSVPSQVVYVLKRLWKSKEETILSIFADKKDRSERVAAFLAILELVKENRVKVEGDGQDCKLILMRSKD